MVVGVVSLRPNESTVTLAPEEWKAGDFAITRRRSPVDFFRVMRVELVPGDPWPVLVPPWCCSRCEDLDSLIGGRRANSYAFRHASRKEIAELSGRSFCLYRGMPRERVRVGACTRSLRELVELLVHVRADQRGAVVVAPERRFAAYRTTMIAVAASPKVTA
jgi:hypothetical protein